MPFSFLLRINVVWLLLVVATILSFAMEWLIDIGDGSLSRYSAIPILAIAFIKVRFVILDFMELRDSPIVLRLVNELWIIATGAILIYIFWGTRGFTL